MTVITVNISCKNIATIGDLYCGEVQWVLLKRGRGNMWQSRLLEMILDDIMIHWVKIKRGNEKRMKPPDLT